MPEPPLIAIVDDNQAIRTATQTLFRSTAFRTCAFKDAESFLDSPLRGVVACLIADMHMPGMSGLELYLQLVAAGRRIPTIIITAHPQELTQMLALEAGISCYLTKPFTADQLLECVHRALATSQVSGYPQV